MTERSAVVDVNVAGTALATPPQRTGTSKRAPWWLWLASTVVLVPVAVPLIALLLRAFGATDSAWEILFSSRTAWLMARTLALTVAVTASATVVGVAGAWILTRTSVPLKRMWGVAFAMPLVIPSYVIALVLVSASGPRGMLSTALGVSLPHLVGFAGAWLALTISTYPYVFLITAAAMQRVDPALEEVARSLGARPWRVFRTVVVPQLRPAIGAGALLSALYTLSDFGAVSLVRFDAFTRVIYAQYAGRLDRTPAIVLSAVLIIAALAIIVAEQRTRGRGAYFTTKPNRPPSQYALSRGRSALATSFVAVVVGVGLVLPIAVLGGWLLRGLRAGIGVPVPWDAVAGSLTGGLLAALVAVAAAVPIAVLTVRYASRRTEWLERTVFTTFSLPHITVAIAVVAFAVRYARPVYQTLGILVVVYAAMFLAQATGPAKAALLQVDPVLDDASRSLGKGSVATMARVTVPLMSKGLLAGGLLVFITVIKELPVTLLLRPNGFTTLAIRIWSAADELLYTRAAAAALLLIAISVIPVYYLSIKPKEVVDA